MLEEAKELRITDETIFHDLIQSRLKLSLGKAGQGVRIYAHQAGLIESPDQVLSQSMI